MPDYEADEALDEMFESDEAIDEALDEAARSWSRPRAPKTANGRGLYTPRPQTQFVTQAQLQTLAAKVGAQIRTTTSAINQIHGRAAAAAASAKKEAIDRKKDMASVKNNLSQTQQMAAIMPLLTQPKSLPVAGTDGIPKDTKVLIDSGSTTSLLLPLLLMTSVGGDSSGSGGGLFGGGSDNSTLLMLALVLGLGR
jgi:hypothetical protein